MCTQWDDRVSMAIDRYGGDALYIMCDTGLYRVWGYNNATRIFSGQWIVSDGTVADSKAGVSRGGRFAVVGRAIFFADVMDGWTFLRKYNLITGTITTIMGSCQKPCHASFSAATCTLYTANSCRYPIPFGISGIVEYKGKAYIVNDPYVYTVTNNGTVVLVDNANFIDGMDPIRSLTVDSMGNLCAPGAAAVTHTCFLCLAPRGRGGGSFRHNPAALLCRTGGDCVGPSCQHPLLCAGLRFGEMHTVPHCAIVSYLLQVCSACRGPAGFSHPAQLGNGFSIRRGRILRNLAQGKVSVLAWVGALHVTTGRRIRHRSCLRLCSYLVGVRLRQRHSYRGHGLLGAWIRRVDLQDLRGA